VKETIDLILQHETHGGKVVAVGEVGLDFQYSNEKLRDLQLKVFHEMFSAAEKQSLPVIIHSRGTTSRIVKLLPSYGVKKILLHWFSQPMKLLSQIVDRGYYISEGLPCVYSSHIQEVVRRVPLTNLLTETDGPVSFRGPFEGKMTTPAFLSNVIKAVAQIKKMEETEVADQILQNFTNFFGISFAGDVSNNGL
jgi:TatD DNase family protein